MRVTLLLDEHVPRALAKALIQQGIEVIHVADTQLRGMADEDLLAEASRMECAFVTYNVRHFAALAVRWANEHREHAGLLLVTRRRPIGQVALRMAHTLASYAPDALRNATIYV